MITSRTISQAIKNATGYEGVKVSKAQGCARFYIDEDFDSQGIDLSLTDAQYVDALSQWSLPQWVEAFVFELEQTSQPTERPQFFAIKQGNQFLQYDTKLDPEAIYFGGQPTAWLFRTRSEASEYGSKELAGNWSIVSV